MTNGPPEELGMNTFHINSVENHGLIESAAGYMPLDVASAYSAILKRLVDITHADTKNWHHRPVYRIAWIHYYIFRNPDKAKSELVKLFTLKPTIKNHINIWKPTSELPGKHYVYIHKYTMFLIKLAKETRDESTLDQLNRKLRKAQSLLLNYEQVMNEISHIEKSEQKD
ncbi:hypothetical protein RMATCC62417_18548 [Rhizopus microsporus]|nr:hypothetical protein RMATCC62417_18548 [Rhizopus microsporus]